MPTKTEWIISQLQSKESPNEAASRFNTPITIANPVTQKQVPAKIDLIAIRGLVPDDEAFKVTNTLIWGLITEAIKKNDLIVVASHIKSLVGGGVLSEATVAKIMPFISATVLDSNWTAEVTVSPAQLAGFDYILVSEVQEAIDS